MARCPRRLHTTGTHPNMRASITACSGLGYTRTLYTVLTVTSSRLEAQCVKPFLSHMFAGAS
jgi:hypothetical protein